MARFESIEATADCPRCAAEIKVAVSFKFVQTQMPDESYQSLIMAYLKGGKPLASINM